MSLAAANEQDAELAVQQVRGELARCAAAGAGTAVVLRYLVAEEDPALFSDAVIAGVRGILSDLAAQLSPAGESRPQREELAQALAQDAMVLAHVHAMVLEARAAQQIWARTAIDPVLSPLVAKLAEGADSAKAELAGRVIEAQAAFVRWVRQMQLPLAELPQSTAERMLAIVHERAGTLTAATDSGVADAPEPYERRDALLDRLAASIGAERFALEQAGLALFVSALARDTGQPRAEIVRCLGQGQVACLALALRAAGLGQAEIAQQIELIHPDARVARGYGAITPAQARDLLAGELTAEGG